MQNDLILQRPPTSDNAELLLLFHGVGSSAEDLAPLGQALTSQRPNAWVISARSPDRSDLGQGWQWFSVRGVTEANRPERVASAMPVFLERIRAWQSETGVGPLHTTLVGFSQGAIMALESTQLSGASRHAARVVAIAGRFAQPPRINPENVAVHLLHGEQDQVMPIRLALEAERELRSLGSSPTLDRFAGLGHGIDARVLQVIGRRLRALNEEKGS
jgi:phospholipase/carboxylesterase